MILGNIIFPEIIRIFSIPKEAQNKALYLLFLICSFIVVDTESLPSADRGATTVHDHPHVVDFVNDKSK